MGISGTRNLFEGNDYPEDPPVDSELIRKMGETTTHRLLHNGNEAGTCEVTVTGNVVSMNLNEYGSKIVSERVSLRVS